MTRSRLQEDVQLVRLDRRLAIPLFRQVYQRIRDAILDGTLSPGASLPSSRSLAAQLSTARGTIELAYTLLAGEDYILGRRASGTVVNPRLRHLLTPGSGHEPAGSSQSLGTSNPACNAEARTQPDPEK